MERRGSGPRVPESAPSWARMRGRTGESGKGAAAKPPLQGRYQPYPVRRVQRYRDSYPVASMALLRDKSRKPGKAPLPPPSAVKQSIWRSRRRREKRPAGPGPPTRGLFTFAPLLRVRHARSVGARAADPRCRHCPGRASGDRPGRRPHAGHQQRDGLARETAKPAVRHGAATWAPAWRGHPTSARHARVRDRGRGQCFYESWSQSPDM